MTRRQGIVVAIGNALLWLVAAAVAARAHAHAAPLPPAKPSAAANAFAALDAQARRMVAYDRIGK